MTNVVTKLIPRKTPADVAGALRATFVLGLGFIKI